MNYRPELKAIRVPLQKLLLDPNNPRFLTGSESLAEESDFGHSGVQIEASKRMEQGEFHLRALEHSIANNGWQPVDMIFVKKLATGAYVVLEGNRRLTALRSLQEKGLLTEALRKEVDPLPVLEVVGTGDIDESRAQISYLLGVRHHGSLKTWAPFAQAHNIYERYLRIGGMTDQTFAWKDDVAAQVAETLSITAKTVSERLKVYRVMKQLEELPSIKEVGIEGRYYSLVREPLTRPAASPLRGYIVQDPTTFRLDEIGVERMNALCHFSQKKRERAPLSNPAEWKPLEKILKDPDASTREAMLKEVAEEKKKPSEVWARRAAELRVPRWDRWLKEVAELLKRVQVGNIEAGKAVDVATRLAAILDDLEKAKPKGKQEPKQEPKQELKQELKQESNKESAQQSKQPPKQESDQEPKQESKPKPKQKQRQK